MTVLHEMDNIDIDISVANAIWDTQIPDYKPLIESCLEQIISHVPEAQNFRKFNHLELSVLLTDDQNIHILNRDYRGKDKPTNVLSFPSLSEDEIERYLRGSDQLPQYPVSLGDVIFAYETIAGESVAQGKKFEDYFCHLSVHGILHLLGYDHMNDKEQRKMESIEKAILLKLSIDDPYRD